MIGPQRVPVWPEGQEIVAVGQVIRYTTFADIKLYHPALKERVLEHEERIRRESPPPTRCAGGVKVRRPDRWEDCPEMQLIHNRAKSLFRRVTGNQQAYVDACWTNVYRKMDSIGPHSHRRTVASLLYMLDPGEEDDFCEFSGRFAVVDPRADVCCRIEPGFMTNPYFPPLEEGTLLIFPAQLVHHVNAYAGDRPRITLTWNINPTPVEGTVAERPQLREIETRIFR